MEFFAHSTERTDRSDWQLLRDHLVSVGELAAQGASPFGGESLARSAGLLHDLGKYTAEFQRRLSGDFPRLDHASWGARVACERYGAVGHLLAYGIAGHHAGLANGAEGGERTALKDRLRGLALPPLLDRWRDEITLPESVAIPRMRSHSRDRGMFQLAFLARMLFSTLVDADYLDTEAFYDRLGGAAPRGGLKYATLEDLRAELDAFLARFRPDTEVNRIRAEVLRQVRQKAHHEPGLFSLTVPTGGGKTLASLAFALDHAIQQGLRRVIFVIPFTSIVEQNAAVFRTALGPLGETSVLEHHSTFVAKPPSRTEPDQYQAREKLRLAMENWDAPIIVTTAVQFFESLFSARPSKCRKLHNIAASVVILDEAQTLPIKLLRPCVAAIDELARNYRTSVIMCTATQPALEAPSFNGGFENVRELADDPPALFHALKRVRVHHIGTLDDEALTDQLRSRDQVLCIVNNRRHARSVHASISDLPGARHLTTLMCARHRSEILDEVRAMLKRREPCRLVSTSLIEAGVDVSFPAVFRAEAGLDSIAQAAGRCNRNGEWPVDRSEVNVFATINDDWKAPPELRQFAQAAREVLRAHAEDPLSLDAISAYFTHLYWRKGELELDAGDILGLLRSSRVDSLPLETVASRFRMIETAQVPVIVPYDDAARDSLARLRHADKVGSLARRLQPYLVQVPRTGFESLHEVGAIQPVAPERWGEQFMELANLDLYDSRTGLSWEDPSFMRQESLVW